MKLLLLLALLGLCALYSAVQADEVEGKEDPKEKAEKAKAKAKAEVGKREIEEDSNIMPTIEDDSNILSETKRAINYNPSIYWPRGSYGLLRAMPRYSSHDGCPCQGHWRKGYRRFDTEDSTSVSGCNKWDGSNHCYGSGHSHYSGATNPLDWYCSNMKWHFCMKHDHGDGPTYWPCGKYCILRYPGKSCPAGFSNGHVYWDDEDTGNINSVSGFLPRGSYNQNTRIDFCCKNCAGTSTSTRIVLPTCKNFILFPIPGHGCQQVKGMHAHWDWFQWNCEDGCNCPQNNWASGFYPRRSGVMGCCGANKNHKIYTCWYH